MPPWVMAAVLFSAVLHASWNAVLRGSKDRTWTVSWIGIGTFLVCGPFLPFLGLPHGVWPNIFVSSSLHVVYLGLLAKAYQLNELSFAYPIARGSSPVLVATGGFLVAAELPRPAQVIGIGLIVGGIVGIGLESKTWDRRGFLIALAIGAVVSIYTVIDGMAARKTGLPLQYNFWCFSFYGAAVLLLKLRTDGPQALRGKGSDLALAVGGGATSVAAYAIVTWAMMKSPLGTVSALRETSTLFAAAIGALILKERFSVRKAVFCVAIVSGAALIGLR